MYKLILYNGGTYINKILRYINYEQIEIIGCISNHIQKKGTEGWTRYRLSALSLLEYDAILVLGNQYKSVTKKLIRNKVPEEKIIQIDNYTALLPNSFFFGSNLRNNDITDVLFRNCYAVRNYTAGLYRAKYFGRR